MSLLNYFGMNKSESKSPPAKKRRLTETTTTDDPVDEIPSKADSPKSTLSVEDEKKRIEELNRQRAVEIRKRKAEERKLASLLPFLTEPGWRELLLRQAKQPYFTKLLSFLESEKAAEATVYPPSNLIFNIFNSCPVEKVKVVILGQDPYHGAKQAMGMSFSVPVGIRVPPSLVNIYKELQSDSVPFTPPKHGNLQEWANQGVFLLNTVLTVRAKSPNSHQNQGWENFTDSVISEINSKCDHVVFMLWGSKARAKTSLINKQKHKILTCAHPSPYSADNGFFGCKHFSKANEWLRSQGQSEVKWQLSVTPPDPPAVEVSTPTTKLPAAPLQLSQNFAGLKRKRDEQTSTSGQPVEAPKVLKKLDPANNGPWKWEQASVECIIGDMVNQKVDIIVNPANSHMKHAGGLARAIEVAGGDAVRVESNDWIAANGSLKCGQVAQTTGGYLPCKVLFHVVGPYWKGGKNGESEKLALVVNNCLAEADKVGIGSIALPAISTGQYKYPISECADVMLGATKKYLQSHSESSIRLIRFVLFDLETQTAFVEAANKK